MNIKLRGNDLAFKNIKPKKKSALIKSALFKPNVF